MPTITQISYLREYIRDLQLIADRIWEFDQDHVNELNDLPAFDRDNEPGQAIETTIDRLEDAHMDISSAIEYLIRIVDEGATP